MELTPGERITLMRILPTKASNTAIRLIHEARMRLSFSEEEHKDLKIVEIELSDGRGFTRWDPKKADTTKDIELGEFVTSKVAEALRKMDKEDALSEDCISLWDKFIK